MHTSSHASAADIVIPVHNNFGGTRTLLESIYRQTDVPFHIYVIDNNSGDETVDLAAVYTRDITVVRNRQDLGWCSAANLGIDLSRNPHLVFMSNDVEVSKGWLGNLISFLDTHPRIGAVGPLNSSPDDRQGVDRVRRRIVPQLPQFFTEDLHARNRILRFHFHRTGILVDGPLALFCLAVKRRAVDEVGPLDQSSMERGAGDYCRRLRRAGYVLGLSLETYVLRHRDRGRSPICAERLGRATVGGSSGYS